jgi:hypothetical protein
MNKELPPEIESLREEAMSLCLKTLLPQEDQLSLIVTGHLYVEYWLEWLIRKSIPRPEKLLDSVNLTFVEKLAVAESLGLLRNSLVKAIRRLNNIRNQIAHKLEYQIPQEDLQLLASFTPDWANKYQVDVSHMGSPKVELVLFCAYFAGYAVGIVEGRKNTKGRKLSKGGA